jgi:hypothetical protein
LLKAHWQWICIPGVKALPVNEYFSGIRTLTFMISGYPAHGVLFSAAKVLEVMVVCNALAHKPVRLSKREPHGPDSEDIVN